MLPLALAPYFWSLAAWLAGTGYAFYRVLRGYLPSLDPAALVAFPAVFVNAAHGQNGFFSAALIGGGLLAMDAKTRARRPSFRPSWRSSRTWLWSSRLRSSSLADGPRWLSQGLPQRDFALCRWSCSARRRGAGFFADSSFARSALENNLVGDEKMQSVFAAARLLHQPIAFAWGAQIATAMCVLVALWMLQRRALRSTGEAPAVVCAGLLASPFLLDYDLTLMAIPLVWLLGPGLRAGFLPFEKALMALAFLLPLISRVLAGAVGLPLAPLTIAALFALTMRRALKPAANREPRVTLGTNMEIGLSLAPER